MGEATEGMHEVGATLAKVPSVVGPWAGIFLLMMISSSNQLHVSPPCASQMPDKGYAC